MAEILKIHPKDPQARHLERAATVLKGGGVVIYPTDTVYGIGCDVTCREAIQRIAQIKGRSDKKPFSFICADLSEISRFARISDPAFRILRRCLPGPYTFVFRGTAEVPRLLRSKQKTVGVRIPDHPVSGALVRLLGRPILSTSANRSGEEVIVDPGDSDNRLIASVDLVLSVGPLPVLPSTVVSLAGEQPEVLRAGAGDISLFP